MLRLGGLYKIILEIISLGQFNSQWYRIDPNEILTCVASAKHITIMMLFSVVTFSWNNNGTDVTENVLATKLT